MRGLKTLNTLIDATLGVCAPPCIPIICRALGILRGSTLDVAPTNGELEAVDSNRGGVFDADLQAAPFTFTSKQGRTERVSVAGSLRLRYCLATPFRPVPIAVRLGLHLLFTLSRKTFRSPFVRGERSNRYWFSRSNSEINDVCSFCFFYFKFGKVWIGLNDI